MTRINLIIRTQGDIMGYTHYFHRTTDAARNIDPKLWEAICKDVFAVLSAVVKRGIPLAGDYNTHAFPLISDNVICFNGVGEHGHESFCFERAYKNVPCDWFCKTERKYYDTAVVAVLLILKHHLGDGLKLGSDGQWSSWSAGARLVGYTLNWPTDNMRDARMDLRR